MPSASKLLGDLVSSAGAISVTSGVANTAITGTITTAQIADDAITTAKVAASAILTADIADANVTDAKIVGVANTKVTGRMTASQLANTAVTAGVYGGSSNSALITVDSQGRITAASNVAASGYSGPQGFEVFNTPGTFTLPPGITAVKVSITGGGGGAAAGSGESAYGRSGGLGGFGVKVVTGLTGPVAVTVGSGGNQPAGAGGSSTFGPFVTATGGNGGNGLPFAPGSFGNPGASPGSTINSVARSAYKTTGFDFEAGQQGGGANDLLNGTAGRVIVEY